MITRQLSLVVALLAAAPAHAGGSATRFVEDDYDAARVQAKARKVPIFIEVWAPW
jgi:hypothetical protein